ncbi:hypothetical protein C1646_751048 [Rhizophagus diaphanus]|nr:hypothetical protein C1646_751048 [Rhizophagus diaphanus] [Rhizophagus sp. MUCL 43196]
MPTGSLPKEALKEVRIGKHYTKWENTEIWDKFFIEKIPNSSRSESHNALGAELNILIRKLKPNTRASQKALFLQNNLKNDRNLKNQPSYDEQSRKIENEEEPNSTVEELTFEPQIGTLLLSYRKVLEEILPRLAVNIPLLESVLMENQNKRIHHAVLIMRSFITKDVVDDANCGFKKWLTTSCGFHTKEHFCIIDLAAALTTIISVLLYLSTPCRGPGSKPSEIK